MTRQVDPDPATALSDPRFLDAGEAALAVECGDTVDPAINDRVLAVDTVLRADPPTGTRELVPTYRSLMIHYDPLQIDGDMLVAIDVLARFERHSCRGREFVEVAPRSSPAKWLGASPTAQTVAWKLLLNWFSSFSQHTEIWNA